MRPAIDHFDLHLAAENTACRVEIVRDQIPDGEVVTTTGARSVFPPDIPVGTVVAVESAADQLSLVLTIDPLADLDNLAYVRVVRWTGEG